MKPERIQSPERDPDQEKDQEKDAISVLKEQGWQCDDSPRAVEKHFHFATYADTLSFLVEVGSLVEKTGLVPSILVDRNVNSAVAGGTVVLLRIGQPPAPALAAAEITFARSLPAAA